MSKIVNLRAVVWNTTLLLIIATIIHVINKDLLGLRPEYHLTSAVLTIFIGAFLLLAWPMISGNHKKFVLAGTDATEWYDIRTTIIFFIFLALVGWGMEWTGFYAEFHLTSVLETLFFGGILIILSSLGYRIRARKSQAEPDMA